MPSVVHKTCYVLCVAELATGQLFFSFHAVDAPLLSTEGSKCWEVEIFNQLTRRETRGDTWDNDLVVA